MPNINKYIMKINTKQIILINMYRLVKLVYLLVGYASLNWYWYFIGKIEKFPPGSMMQLVKLVNIMRPTLKLTGGYFNILPNQSASRTLKSIAMPFRAWEK